MPINDTAITKQKKYRSNKSLGLEVADAYNPNVSFAGWTGRTRNWLKAYNPDDLVKSTSLGIKIYQDMTREPIVKAALMQKKTSLLSVPWDVRPASNSDDHQAQARFTKYVLKNMHGGFHRDIFEMCDALDCGYAILEKLMDVVADGEFIGKVRYTALKSKDPYYFSFGFDPYMNIEPDGIIMNLSAKNEPDKRLPRDKFFVFSYLKKYENAYGTSDLRAAYRAFWIKDTAWKLRSIYMERFSGNNLKGKYPRNKDAEANKQALLNVFKSWQNETGVAIPDDLEIDVITIATSSDSEYARAMADCNADIAIGILGETLTINEGKRTGARNMGEIHKDVADLSVLFLDMTLSADINEQIIRPLIDMNYPDVQEYPEFFFFPREDYDPVAFSQFVAGMQQSGMPVSKNWVQLRTRMPGPSGEDDELEREQPEPDTPQRGETPETPGSPSETEDERTPEMLSEKTSSSVSPHHSGYYRELSKWEQFAEIPKVDKRLMILQDKSLSISRPAYEQIFANVLRQVQQKNVLESRDFLAAMKIAVNPAPLKDVLFRTLLTAHMMGRADVVTETANQGFDFGRISKFAEFDWTVMDGPFTPEEAIQFFSGKVPMTREEFEALAQKIMDESFYVTGLEKLNIERDVKQLITEALKNGMTSDEFKFKLNELQVKYAKPAYGRVGMIGESLLDYHANTVFRTNLMDAYNSGRKDMYRHPDVREYFPAFEYSAIMDGRTTEVCSSLDGMIRLADDPIWDRVWPPNHYNCRSTVITINKYDFTRDMITAIPNVEPDKGFGG